MTCPGGQCTLISLLSRCVITISNPHSASESVISFSKYRSCPLRLNASCSFCCNMMITSPASMPGWNDRVLSLHCSSIYILCTDRLWRRIFSLSDNLCKHMKNYLDNHLDVRPIFAAFIYRTMIRLTTLYLVHEFVSLCACGALVMCCFVLVVHCQCAVLCLWCTCHVLFCACGALPMCCFVLVVHLSCGALVMCCFVLVVHLSCVVLCLWCTANVLFCACSTAPGHHTVVLSLLCPVFCPHLLRQISSLWI
jgi:hypothetical protein